MPSTQPVSISGTLSGLLSQIPDAMQEQKKVTAREDQLSEQAVTAQEAAGTERKKIAEEYRDKLQPPVLDKYVPPEPTSFVDQWGSAAMWLATLGSLLSRNHLTTALTAAGSVMSAYAQGDKQRAETAFKQWEVSTQNAIKMHEYELETYKALMDNAGIDADTKMAMFKTYADAHKNSALQQVTSSATDIAQVQHYLNDFKDHNQKLKDAAEDTEVAHKLIIATHDLYEAKKTGDQGKIAEAQSRYDETRSEVQAYMSVRHPSGEAALEKIDLAKTGGALANRTPEQRQADAGQAATGQPLSQIVPGYGKDAVAARQQIKSDAIKKIQDETGMSASDAGAELARRAIEYQSGKTSVTKLNTMYGATKQAVDQLDFNIEKTKQEMKKLGSTDISPVFNALIRGEEKWTGDPAYSSLFYYMQATATESARILAGGQASVAQLAEGAREEAKQWADVGMTPAAFDSVAQAMRDEGQERLTSFRDAMDSQLPGAPQTKKKKYQIGDTVTDPNGVKHKITGFDADGTPLGDVVQ